MGSENFADKYRNEVYESWGVVGWGGLWLGTTQSTRWSAIQEVCEEVIGWSEFLDLRDQLEIEKSEIDYEARLQGTRKVYRRVWRRLRRKGFRCCRFRTHRIESFEKGRAGWFSTEASDSE